MTHHKEKTTCESFYLPNDQVLFMKDNDNKYRSRLGSTRSLSQMRNQTSQRGFACGSTVRILRRRRRRRVRTNSSDGWKEGVSTNYAERLILGRYSQDAYYKSRANIRYAAQ
jgi:hypothetical protein